MTTRTHTETVTFSHPFALNGIGRTLPPGDYRVTTEEELIEQLSFPVWRRVATSIVVPAETHRASSYEMIAIDPLDLQGARDRDSAATSRERAASSPPVAGPAGDLPS